MYHSLINYSGNDFLVVTKGCKGSFARKSLSKKKSFTAFAGSNQQRPGFVEQARTATERISATGYTNCLFRRKFSSYTGTQTANNIFPLAKFARQSSYLVKEIRWLLPKMCADNLNYCKSFNILSDNFKHMMEMYETQLSVTNYRSVKLIDTKIFLVHIYMR